MNNTRYSSMTRSQAAGRISTQPQGAVCPVCGGLECLCRPRFFPGQLLTDEDLTRLDRYITGKNKLHNRMLFGWGVVNGLEVTCSPCADQVMVSAGYALSPCGDDIVVCKDTSVDICKLANDCCDNTRANDCGPYAPQPNPECQDLEQKWILAICYDETPSRGVTPLRDTGTACCSRCSCGGSSSCGCSCHSKSGQGRASTRSTSARPPAPQCEPTVICEGYRFTLYQLPKLRQDVPGYSANNKLSYGRANALANAQAQGELGRRFIECINDLLALIEQVRLPQDAGVDQLYNWCCALRIAFQDYLAQNGGTACALYDALNGFRCPDPNQFQNNPAGYRDALQAELGKLTSLMQQSIYSCLCSALLPPVPPASADNCVPLAVVTLRRRDCRVIDICNTSARKFAITFTNLAYWLSPFEAIFNQFRQALDRLCCTQRQYERAVPIPVAGVNHINMLRSAGFNTPLREAPGALGARFRQAWDRRETGFDPRSLILDTIGLAKPNGEPYLTPLERSDPLQSLLLDNLVVPFLSSLSQPGPGEQPPAPGARPAAPADEAPAAAEAGQPQPGREQPAEAPSTDDLARLQARLDELASLVAKQQAQIADLRKERAPRASRSGKGKEDK